MSEGLREELSRLGTEASNPRTAHIDEMGTMEALEAINDLDTRSRPPCAASCRPSPRSSTPPTSGWSEGGV